MAMNPTTGPSAPGLSLVVAVYNKPDVLSFLLAACARQSFTDFEVIVADDGSGPAVANAIRDGENQYAYPILHLWHEDRGWRKNIMLNNAIRAARSEYMVFIDGDCLPTRYFLEDHWNERQQGRVLLGRRVETSKRWSETLTLQEVQTGDFENLGWPELMDGMRGNALRLEDSVRIRSRLVRNLLLRNVRGMLGSNFSVFRKDLVAVNGFDELYDGPGCGEDSDIQHRLSLIGITGKSMRNLAILYHLHHPATSVSLACRKRFEDIQKSREPRCSRGLEKLA